MPGRFSLTLETPALAAPAGWSGPVAAIFDAVVQRGVNRAGTFTITVPADAPDVDDARYGWRATLRQERVGVVDSAGDPVPDAPLLYRGKILRSTPIAGESGAIVRILEGETWLGSLRDHWIHSEQKFTTTTLQAILTTLLTPLGVSFSVPGRCTRDTFSIDLSDITILDALIRLAEYTRTNLVDTFTDVVKFADKDQLFDPTLTVNADDPTLRLVGLEAASRDAAAAARAGFGIIAGTPVVTWDASELANRIKAVGVDFDGKPLSLEGADVGNYAILSAAGPSETYYYIEDTESVNRYTLAEAQVVRADIKNPSDDPGTRLATRRVLAAIATGEMLRRRSEIFTLQAQLLDGEDIFALPGDRVWVRYKGRALLPGGAVTTIDVDRWLVVVRRGDRAGGAGVRLVNLDLSGPELTYSIPGLPEAIPIPTPNESQLPPPRTPVDPEASSYSDDGAGWLDDPLFDLEPIDPAVVDEIVNNRRGVGNYQRCCAPPTGPQNSQEEDDGGIPWPVRLCAVPWADIETQDTRFVDVWTGLDPDKTRFLLALTSASADPVGVAAAGCTLTQLGAWESPTPANFGGDGYGWWKLYYGVVTASTIDISGTTGAFRNITFFLSSQDLPGTGLAGGGVDVNMVSDLQYHGAQPGEAIEIAVATQGIIFRDAIWNWIDMESRTIDDIYLEKDFHAEDPAVFNHDYDRFNSDFIPMIPGGGASSSIDWLMIDPENDGFLSHTITASYRTRAVADPEIFPNSCRILAFNVTVRMRILCPVFLFA